MTSLNPVYGLYTSFFPSLTYVSTKQNCDQNLSLTQPNWFILIKVIFASSRHLSVGTFALVSLMVYGSVSKLEAEFLVSKRIIQDISFQAFQDAHNESFVLGKNANAGDYITESELMAFRVKVATGLAFWCGIIQLCFSIFRLGSVTKYLSQPMLRGFNTASAFHVFTTQMQHVFGIYAKTKPTRVFKLIFVCDREFMNWKFIIYSNN